MARHYPRILSFKYAFSGIYQAFIEEPNLKFHFLAGFLVFLAGILLEISSLDWVILIILVGLVIAVELTNTALETIVDSFTIAEHPGAKRAKDISAGAVLVVAITAFIVGLITFIPYLG